MKIKRKFLCQEICCKRGISKALGTGFRKSVYWRDIEVINNKSGKPELFLHNGKIHV